MADGRILKKRISVSEQVADLKNDLHRLLFTWCIPHLDVEGRMTGSARKIRATVCPLLEHVSTSDIELFLADASRAGLIQVYTVDGEAYMFMPGFLRHQTLRKDKEAKSCIPAPDVGDVSDYSGTTPGQLPDNDGTTPAEVIRREDNNMSGFDSRNSNLPDRFSEFWTIYPRRLEKAAAVKAWKARINEGIDAELMIRGAERYAEYVKQQRTEERFIKHAATFLGPSKPFVEYAELQQEPEEQESYLPRCGWG